MGEKLDKEKIIETAKTAGIGGAAGAIAGFLTGRKDKKRGIIATIIWFFIAIIIIALVIALLPAIVGIGLGLYFIKKGNNVAGYIAMGVGVLLSILIFVLAYTQDTALGEYYNNHQDIIYTVVKDLK